jgi:hypothetical protein
VLRRPKLSKIEVVAPKEEEKEDFSSYLTTNKDHEKYAEMISHRDIRYLCS